MQEHILFCLCLKICLRYVYQFQILWWLAFSNEATHWKKSDSNLFISVKIIYHKICFFFQSLFKSCAKNSIFMSASIEFSPSLKKNHQIWRLKMSRHKWSQLGYNWLICTISLNYITNLLKSDFLHVRCFKWSV